ncbi:MAG: hypothetical protein WBZ33_14310 [Thermoactinomyces sp.]
MKYCSCTRDGTVLEVFENISEAEYDPEKNIVRFIDQQGGSVMFSGMTLFLFLPDSVAVAEGDTVTPELQAQDIRYEAEKTALSTQVADLTTELNRQQDLINAINSVLDFLLDI